MTSGLHFFEFVPYYKENVYFTNLDTNKRIEEGDWYLQGDAEGGSKQIFDVKRYKGGEEPHGYAVIVASSDKKLKLPLIPESFIRKYNSVQKSIKKVKLKFGKRNIQVGDSTMGEVETITEPQTWNGFVIFATK